MNELAVYLEGFTPSVCLSGQVGKKSFASLSEMEELVVELVSEELRLQEKLFYLEADEAYQANEIVAMREEIRLLRREKDRAIEKVFNLGMDCRVKYDLNSILTSRNQELKDKILWASSQLDTLEHAYINEWMQGRMAEKLISPKKKLKDVSLKEVKELLDSVREKIGEIEKELMA